MLQRLPFQKFHDDKGLPLVLSGFVDHADVRMIQSRGGARFPLQPFQAVGCSRKTAGKKLQRHRARQHQVFGPVDHAHAALPQQARRCGTVRSPGRPGDNGGDAENSAAGDCVPRKLPGLRIAAQSAFLLQPPCWGSRPTRSRKASHAAGDRSSACSNRALDSLPPFGSHCVQLLIQPGARHPPFTIDGAGRNAQHFRDLVLGHSREESHLYYLALAAVHLLQARQRLFEHQQVARSALRQY